MSIGDKCVQLASSYTMIEKQTTKEIQLFQSVSQLLCTQDTLASTFVNC